MKKEYLNDTLHCTFASMISRYFVYSSSQHFTYAYPILFSSVSGCLLHKSLITNWMYVKHITKKKIVRYNGMITINEIKNSICLTVFIMFCYFLLVVFYCLFNPTNLQFRFHQIFLPIHHSCSCLFLSTIVHE